MKQAFFKLHLSVLLAGFTGIFGKLVTLHQLPLTWWRLALATLLLWVLLASRRMVQRVTARQALMMAGVGLLLGVHWVLFYGSIKSSSISVGVVCFSTVGFFSALLEPLIMRRRFSWLELLFSLLTVAGIALIFHFNSRYRWGIAMGVVSSVICALYTITNRLVSSRTSKATTTILLWEMLGGCAGLTLLMPLFHMAEPAAPLVPGMTDLLWLLALASVCTIGLYMLQIQVLRHISAFTMNLTYNLEPVYSIVIACLFFGEAKEFNASFFAGLALLLLSVALQTWRVSHADPPGLGSGG